MCSYEVAIPCRGLFLCTQSSTRLFGGARRGGVPRECPQVSVLLRVWQGAQGSSCPSWAHGSRGFTARVRGRGVRMCPPRHHGSPRDGDGKVCDPRRDMVITGRPPQYKWKKQYVSCKLCTQSSTLISESAFSMKSMVSSTYDLLT